MKKYDIANGKGLRTSVWFCGCNFHCKDCFNKDLWSFESGKDFNDIVENELINNLSDPHCQGLSVLGGEPLEQGDELLRLLLKVRSRFPSKDIWLWTGYRIDEITKLDDIRISILLQCDYIVDGRFDTTKKKGHFLFRGSSNQKIYKNENGKFIQIENPEEYFK